MNQYLLFFVSALGVMHGVLLTFYLLITKRQDKQFILLALLLLCISVRIGKSVAFYFYPDASFHLLQVGLSACFMIGPITFAYVAYALDEKQSLQPAINMQLGLLASALLCFGLLYPYAQFPQLWQGPVYITIHWLWAGYLLIAGIKIIDYVRRQKWALKALTMPRQLALGVWFSVTLIWASYGFSSYTSYLTGAMCFSITLYIAVMLYFLHARKPLKKYANRQINADQAAPLLAKVDTVMRQGALYTDGQLTLGALAKACGLSLNQLSQLLNDNLGQSFNHYINGYRINAAAELLENTPNLSVEVIAEQCGYYSNSTFYAAFKQHKGCTPGQYRKQHSQPPKI